MVCDSSENWPSSLIVEIWDLQNSLAAEKRAGIETDNYEIAENFTDNRDNWKNNTINLIQTFR